MVWISFQALRRAKRAPISDLVILTQRREATKAGISLEDALTFCCEAGWQSFNAEWWKQRQEGRQQPRGQQPESFYERDQRLKREEARKWGGGSSTDTTDFLTIDAEAHDVPTLESN